MVVMSIYRKTGSQWNETFEYIIHIKRLENYIYYLPAKENNSINLCPLQVSSYWFFFTFMYAEKINKITLVTNQPF